jgi:hypothetical protein
VSSTDLVPVPLLSASRARRAEAAVVSGGADADSFAEAMREIGFPSGILHLASQEPGGLTWQSLLTHIPPAPRPVSAPGGIIAVLGDDEAALRTAALIAERVGTPEAGRAYGGAIRANSAGRRLSGAPGVAAWRGVMSRQPHPSVVAIVLGSHPLEREAGARLLAAAEADQVWAVVDPRMTVADTRKRLAAIEREHRIDAVAVSGAYEAAQPAAALGLGVPVGLLDGVPATRIAWAAALSQTYDDAQAWAA